MENSVIETLYAEFTENLHTEKEHSESLNQIRQLTGDNSKSSAIEELVGIIASITCRQGFKAGFIAGMKLAAELNA
jgi:hypothetical protein